MAKTDYCNDLHLHNNIDLKKHSKKPLCPTHAVMWPWAWGKVATVGVMWPPLQFLIKNVSNTSLKS